MKTISILVPSYNEKDSINYFFDKIKLIQTKYENEFNIRVVFLNNSSTDNSLEIIKEIKKNNMNVGYITYSKNIGYQNSLFGALCEIESDAYIIIDCDCEDPPELIHEFINYWKEGNSLVYGIRADRDENYFIKNLRKVYYRITKLVADNTFELDMAEFSLFTKNIRDYLIKNKSTKIFIRAELANAGFKKKGIIYKRNKRKFGSTNYNFLRMFIFGMSGFLSTSTFPLRSILYLFTILFILNGLNFFNILNVISFDKLLILNLSFIGYSLASLAIYLARINKDIIGRPTFTIDEKNTSLKF